MDENFSESIVDTIREALLVLDESMHVVSANRSFYRQFSVTREQTEGFSLFQLGNGQWNIPELRHKLETVTPENTSFDDFEVKHRFESLGDRVMLLNGRRLVQGEREQSLVLLAIEDVTERFAAQFFSHWESDARLP